MPRPQIKPRTQPQKASDAIPPAWQSSAQVVDECALFAGGNGTPLSKSSRSELLAKLRNGAEDAPGELELEAVTFLQRDTPNRNFVRFKPGMLQGFAKSFEGQPMLRDHDSRSMMSRGGTIVASKLEHNEDGSKQIRMRMKLVKPWAIEAALDGTLDRFSIGWSRTSPVECSICGNGLMSRECSHWPGEADANGKVCEAMFTGADGTEVSGVNVPAVVGTRIESISQLADIDQDSLACILGENATGSVEPEKAEMSLSTIAVSLGLPATATEADILAANEQNAAKMRLQEQAAKLAKEESDRQMIEQTKLAADAHAKHVNDAIARLVSLGKLAPGDKTESDLRVFAKVGPAGVALFDTQVEILASHGRAVTPVGAAAPAATVDPTPLAATTLDAAKSANPHLGPMIKQLLSLGYDPKEVEARAIEALERQEAQRASLGR